MAAEVARLRGLTYPGHHPGPGLWLDVVTGLLDTGRGYLRRAADPATDDARASELVSDAEQLGDTAYRMLKELDGADADQIPHQIVGPFQRWVDGLGIGNSIFFRADHVANYELRRFQLKSSLENIDDPSQSLVDALAAVTWPFMRLTVPSQALGMLPHFAIVGHELGHAIQDQIRVDLTGLDPSGFDAALRARLAAEGIPFGSSLQLEVGEIISSWVQEFKSDAVGFILAGPAFFFALGGFFEVTGGGYGVGPTHPPSDMRRRLLMDRLAKGAPSHVEVFGRLTGVAIEDDLVSPHLRRLPDDDLLFTELKRLHGPVKAAICVALLPLAELMAVAIFDVADGVIRGLAPGLIYDPADLERDLAHHLDALLLLIPPIETMEETGAKAASLAGILNVGWAALLTRLPSILGPPPAFPGDGDTVRMERLHELLLKAVELSEARMVWDEQP